MVRNGILSVLPTVLVIFVINGLFLYIYLNENQEKTQNLYLRRMSSSFFVHDVLSDANATSALIAQSHLSLHQKQLKIIYYKTHKTASTTVGNILFRLGAQHGVTFHAHDEHYYKFTRPPPTGVDITLNHHTPTGFDAMMQHYKKMIPGGKFLTVLREPTRRYLSHYHYYVEPFGGSFDKFLHTNDYKNFLAKDFGMWDTNALQKFMDTAFDQFIFLITEKLDESLLLLKNAWGWSLQDILYVKLNDACAYGINYARKPMSCRPKFENLTQTQLEIMRKNNALDIALYERALNDTNAQLAAQPESFWNELALFKAMRAELQEMCSGKNKTIPTLCEAYRLDDVRYETRIYEGNGRVSNFSVINIQFGSATWDD